MDKSISIINNKVLKRLLFSLLFILFYFYKFFYLFVLFVNADGKLKRYE